MLKKIVSIFGVLILIVLMFIISLMYGIKIDNISYKNIYLNGLYIKYDKKLILRLNKLELKNNNAKLENTIDNTTIHKKIKLLKYFQLIKIDQINYKNNIIKIDYQKNKLNLLYFDSKNKINLTAKLKEQKLYYKISTDNINSIIFLKDFIKINPKIDKVLFNKLTFDHIKLNSFFGYIDLNNINNLNLDSIYSEFSINNIKLNLDNKHIISINKMNVKINQSHIDIEILKNKKNKDLTLEGVISGNIKNKNLIFKGDLLYKDLRIKTNIETYNKILTYNISTNHIKDIKIFDNFFTYSKDIRVWIVDRLKIENVKLNYAKGKIDLKKFSIDFKTLKADATISNAILDFNPTKAYPVKSKKVFLKFDGNNLSLKFLKPYSNDVKLDNTKAVIYNIFNKSGLKLNIKSITPINKTINRFIKSYDIKLPSNINIIQTKGISNIQVDIDIPFNNDPINTFINIKNNNSTFLLNKNIFRFKNIDFIYKDNKVYIKKINTKYKKLTIDIDNLVYNLKSKIAKIDLSLVKYNFFNQSNKINNIKLQIDLNNEKNIIIKDINNLVNVNLLINKNITTNIKLNNIDFKYENKINNCKNIVFNLPKINFYLQNGSFLYNKKLIKYDTLEINTNKDKIKSKLTINNSIINLRIIDKNIILTTNNLNSKFTNEVFDLKTFKDTLINLNLKGTQCIMHGNINIDKLIIKDYKLNNISSNISLNRNSNILLLNNINAKGKKYFINGDISIDLDKSKIYSNLKINFAKDYSTLISKIPLFNYILLGDDKEISYKLNINGDLNDPEVSTEFIEETTLAPLNMLKRAISLPLKQFDK